MIFEPHMEQRAGQRGDIGNPRSIGRVGSEEGNEQISGNHDNEDRNANDDSGNLNHVVLHLGLPGSAGASSYADAYEIAQQCRLNDTPNPRMISNRPTVPA